MLRYFLMNKWVLGGVGFLILLSVACVWWYQHDIADEKKAAAETSEFARQWEKERKAAAKTVTKDVTKAPAESTTPTAEKPVNKVTAEVENNTEAKSEQQSQSPAENAETAELRVSPHGFGPFPEVPTDYSQTIGIPSWIRTKLFGAPPVEAKFELMERIKIKLWQQGHTNIRGSFMKNGKVIITYSNKVYAQYGTRETPDGKKVRTLLSWTSASVPAPQRDFANPYDTSDLQVPAGITIIEGDEQDYAIDPYKFLGLNNQ